MKKEEEDRVAAAAEKEAEILRLAEEARIAAEKKEADRVANLTAEELY